MSSDAPLYLAFLVRLWRDNAAHGWHVTVKQVGTEKQWQFATMEALYLFLDRNAHDEPPPPNEKR